MLLLRHLHPSIRTNSITLASLRLSENKLLPNLKMLLLRSASGPFTITNRGSVSVNARVYQVMKQQSSLDPQVELAQDQDMTSPLSPPAVRLLPIIVSPRFPDHGILVTP